MDRVIHKQGGIMNKEFKALQLFGAYSRNHFDPWMLAGNSNSSKRQEVVVMFTGVKTPKAKCGVNAIWSMFSDIAKPQGDCMAVRERNFKAWALR